MRLLFLLLLWAAPFFGKAQSNDPALNQRLQTYLEANRRLDFETIMDYIHPKLFKLASREQMIEALRQSFNNEDVKVRLDSMEIRRVSPVFAHGTSAYRRIDYFMTLDLTFTDKEKLADSSFVRLMEESFARSFNGTAVYDPAAETFHVRGQQLMVAIRDRGKPWLFIGHRPDKRFVAALFPQTVINKFRL